MSRIFQAATAAAVGLTALTAIAVTVPGLAQVTPGDTIFEPAIVAADIEPTDTVASESEAAEAETAPQPEISHESLRSMVASRFRNAGAA